MSPETQTPPVALPFGAAFDRLQQIAEALGTDEAIEPERLIALLREGKGLERALREHLDRVEQEVRAIEDGDGAAAFRIVTGPEATGTPAPGPAPASTVAAPAAAEAASPVAAPAPSASPADGGWPAASAAPPASPAPVAPRADVDSDFGPPPSFDAPSFDPPPAAPAADAAPGLFAADDDIPF